MKLKTERIGGKCAARLEGPIDGALTLSGPLLADATPVAEGDDILRRSRQVGDNEAKRKSARSVARLTDALSTPGTAAIAFSTRYTQDAQVMPVMGKLWSGGAALAVAAAGMGGYSSTIPAGWAFQRWVGQAGTSRFQCAGRLYVPAWQGFAQGFAHGGVWPCHAGKLHVTG